MEPIRIPKVRLGNQTFDLGVPLGRTPTQKFEGFVLKPMAKGLRRHLTVSFAGQVLEVHETDEATGAHTIILRVDLYWLVTRLSDPAFLDEFRQRWIVRSFQVMAARDLKAIGTRALMLMHTDNKSLQADADGVVDSPPLYSVAMRGPRHAQPGITWAALDARTNCLGLVWVARVSRKERAVLFTPWADVKAILHWFLSELAGPSGTVPSFEERDVA